MNYWIITVKEPYCGFILLGKKTMELRRKVPPALRPGDVIFIVRKGDHGSIVGACSVTSVRVGSVNFFYAYYDYAHCVGLIKMREYADDNRFLFGIDLKRIEINSWCLNVRSFGYERAPQWFYRIRPEFKSTIERVLDVKQKEGGEK